MTSSTFCCECHYLVVKVMHDTHNKICNDCYYASIAAGYSSYISSDVHHIIFTMWSSIAIQYYTDHE